MPDFKKYAGFDTLSDAELHRWIVESRSEWRRAYEELFHERYAGLVISAKAAIEQRYRTVLHTEAVFGRGENDLGVPLHDHLIAAEYRFESVAEHGPMS